MPQARDEAGNIWEFDGFDANGEPINPRPVSRSAQPSRGTVYTPPPKPEKPREAPSGYRWTASGALEAIPGGPAIEKPKAATESPDNGVGKKVRQDAIRQFYGANSLTAKARELTSQYHAGPGSTRGLGGLADLFPTAQNKRFDDTALQARGFVKDALGFTGGEGNTVGEVQLNYGPYLPEASDWDGRIEGKIDGLFGLADNSRDRAIATLGGVPDANGNIFPLGSPEATKILNDVGHKQPRSAWDAAWVKPEERVAADTFATEEAQQYPPGFQDEYAGYVQQQFDQNGRLDPVAYADWRNQHAKKYGYGERPASDWIQEAETLNGYYERGGRTFAPIMPIKRSMSMLEQFGNSAFNNPIAATMANFGDSATIGAPSYISREVFGNDTMGLVNAKYPVASTIGQVGGAIAGTGALNAAGRTGLKAIAPKLLGGGRGGALARGLTSDVVYSTGYGTATGGDPVNSAIAGGLGSLGGRAVGKVAGAAIGGVKASPMARFLEAKGVPMTTGQKLGGIPKAVEDRMMSVPGVGDLVRNRRIEAFEGFDQAARNAAGDPIGAKFNNGGSWIDELPPQFGNAYDDATRGVSVPIDNTFKQDMAGIFARNLPDDYANALDTVGQHRIGPAIQGGQLTGESYQQAMRGINSAKAKAGNVGNSGFEDMYRGALTDAQGVLKSQMQRGGGQGVTEGLARADNAYRMAKVLQDAQRKAVNGSGSGIAELITPAQLNQASIANLKKFGGKRPFAALAKAGQDVLPSKIPDSGTAGRMMQIVLPAAIAGGGGAGAGYAAGSDPTTGAGTALGLLALLAAGGSKGGQKAINAALFNRPKSAKAAGALIRKNKGLLGSAAIPLMLESQ